MCPAILDTALHPGEYLSTVPANPNVWCARHGSLTRSDRNATTFASSRKRFLHCLLQQKVPLPPHSVLSAHVVPSSHPLSSDILRRMSHMRSRLHHFQSSFTFMMPEHIPLASLCAKRESSRFARDQCKLNQALQCALRHPLDPILKRAKSVTTTCSSGGLSVNPFHSKNVFSGIVERSWRESWQARKTVGRVQMEKCVSQREVEAFG